MNLGLQGKSAIVTGASRGIGLGIASALAAEGCRLTICARGGGALDEAAVKLRGLGADVVTVETDVASQTGVDEVVSAATGAHGGLDVVVSNVGGNRRGQFVDTSDEDWEAVLDVNLRAHIRLARTTLPHLRASGQGALTFVTSIFGREAGGAGLSIYNSTKSALISLSKIMALEEAPHGVRVNNIAPGSIRFEGGSWDRRCKENPDGMADFIKENLPFGRFGTVEEIGDTVAFLSSPRASWVSGVCLNVDGVQSSSLI